QVLPVVPRRFERAQRVLGAAQQLAQFRVTFGVLREWRRLDGDLAILVDSRNHMGLRANVDADIFHINLQPPSGSLGAGNLLTLVHARSVGPSPCLRIPFESGNPVEGANLSPGDLAPSSL